MLISEQQIMQLMVIAQDYIVKIDELILSGADKEDSLELNKRVSSLLREIRTQQSTELKEVK